MILNKNYYRKATFFRSLWNSRQLKNITGEKVFRGFKLFKISIPEKVYFYSPRLKRIPHFSGDTKALAQWKDAEACVQLCPTQAINLTAKELVIDERGCIACGLCVELAPPGILEAPGDLTLKNL